MTLVLVLGGILIGLTAPVYRCASGFIEYSTHSKSDWSVYVAFSLTMRKWRSPRDCIGPSRELVPPVACCHAGRISALPIREREARDPA